MTKFIEIHFHGDEYKSLIPISSIMEVSVYKYADSKELFANILLSKSMSWYKTRNRYDDVKLALIPSGAL